MDKVREYAILLVKHPIMTAWALAIIAIILNWFASGNVQHAPVVQGKGHAEMVSTADQGKGGHKGEGKGEHEGRGEKGEHGGKGEGKEAHNAQGVMEPNPNAQAAASNGANAGAQVAATGAAAQGATDEAGTQVAGAATANTQAAGAVDANATQAANAAGAAVTNTVQPVTAGVNTAVATAPAVTGQGTVVTQTTTSATNNAVATAGAVVQNGATVVTTTVVNQDPLSLLRAARQAYWDALQGNAAKFDESVKLYQQLIGLEPTVPSHKGELANVYWKMEKPDQAADLYIEIGSWLKQNGRTIELINMREYIKIFNPEKSKQFDVFINQ